MCGRYTLSTKDFSKHYGVEQGTFEFSPSYNIAPTQTVLVVLEQWVKTPVAGLVADIRLVEVGVAGVTLEVVVERTVRNPQATARTLQRP